MQKARSQPVLTDMGLPQLVGGRFQVLFHSPPGVLFAFPSRYWFTIGRQGVFSLGRWSSRIHAGFLVPRATQVPPENIDNFAYGPLTPSGAPFQTLRLSSTLPSRRSYNPARLARRFGLFPLRSPLLGESSFLSLPWVLRCFSSPSLASNGLFYSSADARVAPGGLPHSEISGSQLVYSSPKLIAVNHVLHRLLTPQASTVRP